MVLRLSRTFVTTHTEQALHWSNDSAGSRLPKIKGIVMRG
jgi:hypothetical protein